LFFAASARSARLLDRRNFLKLLAVAAAASPGACSSFADAATSQPQVQASATHSTIQNEYTLYLPGEQAALRAVPTIQSIDSQGVTARAGTLTAAVVPGETIGGWKLLTVTPMNGVVTAVFEKHVTHRGAIACVTQERGTIAWIPKYVGSLTAIRPRPVDTANPQRLRRTAQYIPGPDHAQDYLLSLKEDPGYANVAPLGEEYVGWTLVANEQGGPMTCLYLDAAGKSRELGGKPNGRGTWEPDETGAYFDPANFLPGEHPLPYEYKAGFSKRTLLGGYLPVADIGVWNPDYRCGYEVMVLLPPGDQAQPIGRVRVMIPEEDEHQAGSQPAARDADGRLYVDRYWNCSADVFFSQLAGAWNHWSSLYETAMPVEIPDEWLLNSARAGITLSRCSYRGLHPTYQIGEGAYTKIPERSHALFPVAQYEFIWAQQLWNLTADSDAYFQFYLDHYILPDGNFLYNTQDQVEAPLNAGVFLANSARSYFYTGNLQALQKRLPVLERMLGFVLARYAYSKQAYPPGDPRYGLIYGSPEADLGDPYNDYPQSHPFYFENSTWTWRGLVEHARCLRAASQAGGDPALAAAATRYEALAQEMRANIENSLRITMARRASYMKAANITPFTPDDTHHHPQDLSSYENHRFMEDWFLADWGDPELDLGHLRHRKLAGMQILGLGTDGALARTSNFMAHGTLSVKIRQPDYRPYLVSLYGLACFCADSGNFYSPEDAFIPGSFPGEGSPYGWSAVINSTLQTTLGLRWLLCYEQADSAICHLQKAAPNTWFTAGQRIAVRRCPTRFGPVSWSTTAVASHRWKVVVETPHGFSADLAIHIHPAKGPAIRTASQGSVQDGYVLVSRELLRQNPHLELDIT
jgi:hypothetical protein